MKPEDDVMASFGLEPEPPPELALHEPTGLHYRVDQSFRDLEIIGESLAVYQDLNVGPEDVILDLGGHIGSAAQMFLKLGARTISIEPLPSNFEVLSKNVSAFDGRGIAFHAAVGPMDMESMTLYIHPKNHSAMGRTQPVRGREALKVPAVHLEELFEQYKPTIIKCDIEHGEYELPALLNLPKHVRGLFMELHGKIQIGTPDRLLPYNQKMLDLEQAILDQGFRTVFREAKEAWNHPFAICSTYERIPEGG